MTVGAVIFAQNNSSVDYVKMAAFAATRVKQYLDIPVSLITDSPGWLEQSCPDHVFDQVISYSPQNTNYHQRRFNDGTMAHKILEWKNFGRYTAYNFTPYETTLVLDSDYIISSPLLKTALERDYDLQIYKKSFDISGWRGTKEYDRVSHYSVPFYWATTFIFKKNPVTEAFFNLVEYVKDNWSYFRMLYNIEFGTFRNDFAFSIAIHIMNGKTNGNFAEDLPGSMSYVTDRDLLIGIEEDKMRFLIEKENYLGEYTVAKTQGIDVHVMNKYSLTRFIDGGSGV